jgi:hypothetical protein
MGLLFGFTNIPGRPVANSARNLRIVRGNSGTGIGSKDEEGEFEAVFGVVVKGAMGKEGEGP